MPKPNFQGNSIKLSSDEVYALQQRHGVGQWEILDALYRLDRDIEKKSIKTQLRWKERMYEYLPIDNND